jgi:hypothetical protein
MVPFFRKDWGRQKFNLRAKIWNGKHKNQQLHPLVWPLNISFIIIIIIIIIIIKHVTGLRQITGLP